MSHDINKIVDSVVKEIMSESSAPKKSGGKGIKKMTLTASREIIRVVQTKAADMGVKTVVAISDGGGNLIALERSDDAFIASLDIAANKAFTVVSLKMPTSRLASLASPGGSLYGIQFTNNGRIVVFGGGEPLISGGEVIGGLGVSGGTAEQDTFLGEYGRKYFEEHFA